MDLAWIDPARPDERDVAAVAAVLEAGRAVDTPHRPVRTTPWLLAELRHGWDGAPGRHWVARAASGDPVGYLGVDSPHWDNRHMAIVDVLVHPDHRGRGLGRELLEAGLEEARGSGRTLAVHVSDGGDAGAALAVAAGFAPAFRDAERRIVLDAPGRATVDGVRREVEGAYAGYELLHMGAVPEELLEAMSTVYSSINDAPTDDLEMEDEQFPPERIRGFEASRTAHGQRLYRVVARERAGGALAGHTVLAVDADQPWHAEQFDTTVTAEHRGHRLGLALKLAMLEHLATAEPQLRSVDTWNAASNTHMLRVNDTLGAQVVACGVGWQRAL